MGAVLILGGPGFSLQEAQRLLGERISAVPRLGPPWDPIPAGWPDVAELTAALRRELGGAAH
ncbi:MAG TPA: hypothetical protein VIV12_19885 [Streptosporangiaceae bacterium]